MTVVSSEGPGLTAFTVIPWRASATAKYLHILSTAALAEPMPTYGCHPPVTPPGVYDSARIRPPRVMCFAAAGASTKEGPSLCVERDLPLRQGHFSR